MFVSGSLASGYLMERLGRGLVLPAAVLAMGAGLGVECLAPSWGLFVVGAGISGLGSGSVEVGINGLFLDRFHEDRGRAMNRLHLCYSLGALAAPLAVGALVEMGVAWRLPFAITGALVVAVALRLGTRDLGARRVEVAAPTVRGLGARRVPLPLVLLALAIACYVASENGVSSWLVRFLGDAPAGVATVALSLFWAGLTGGRIVASRSGGRFAPMAVASHIAIMATSRGCRVGRLPAPHGLHLERRRARRRDGGRGAERVRLRSRAHCRARARAPLRDARRRAREHAGPASRLGIDRAAAPARHRFRRACPAVRCPA